MTSFEHPESHCTRPGALTTLWLGPLHLITVPTSRMAETQLLDENIRRLLPDRQSSIISVGGNITRHDAEISNLQALDPIDTQTSIDDAVLLPGQHFARAERVPGRAHIGAQPLLKHGVVLCRVLDVGGVSRERPVFELDARGLGPGCKGRVALGHLAAVRGHVPDDLALLLVRPDVLLDVVVARVGEEAVLEVERVA